MKSQSGNFFRVNVGRPAVAATLAKAAEHHFALISLSMKGVILSYILFHDIRGFEILKFRANFEMGMRGGGKNWVGLGYVFDRLVDLEVGFLRAQ